MAKEKEKKKRGRKRKYWKFSSDPPDWLPDGWIMEVGVTQAGDKFKHYLSPVSEQKFRTKKEVLNYLCATKDDGYASEITSCSGDNGQVVIEQVENSHEWLPPGWLVEIRVLMSGGNAGQKYKCYYDPVTGYRFYSKADVLHFLESGKLLSPVSMQKRPSSGTPDNILVQIDYKPDGLPHGWIKENLFRKPSKQGKKFKKDVYFSNPAHGYKFRTLKAAIHYVSTGDVSKYASVIRRTRMHKICSLGSESPPPIPVGQLKSLATATRQCLFTEEATKENGEVAPEFDDSPEKQLTPADRVSSGNIRYTNYKTRKVVEPAAENMLETSKDAEENNCELLVRPIPASEQLDVRDPEPAAENNIETSKDVEKNKCKLLTLPTEESERAAGCETEPATENMLEASNYVDKNKCQLVVPPESKQLDGCELRPTAENIKDVEEKECKLLAGPTRASKPLAAYGPEPTIDYMLETSKHVELPSRASKQLDGCEPEPTAKNMLETPKYVEKNKQRLLTLPTRASKRLAGCEPEPAAENMSETSKHAKKNRCTLLGLPSKLLDGCEDEPAHENMLEASRHVEKNKCKLLTLPTRASRRLAGCEPEQATKNMSETSKHVEKNRCKMLVLPSRESELLNGCEPEPTDMLETSKHVKKTKCKLLTLPTRASKRLAGCEPEVATQHKTEITKCKLLGLPTRASKRPAGYDPEPVSEHMLGITKYVERNKRKLLTLPIRASKRLAGCEPEPSTENMLKNSTHAERNKCKVLVLPSQTSERLDGYELVPEALNILATTKHVEKNKPKLLTLPSRASKRLAGCEPAPAAELVIRRSSCKLRSNGGCDGQSEDPTHEFKEGGAPLEPKDGLLSNDGSDGNKEQLVTENLTDDRPLALPAFPFLDAWKDPWIEFAVKTLMGDEIPVIEETAAPSLTPCSSTNQCDLDQDKLYARPEKLQKVEGDREDHIED